MHIKPTQQHIHTSVHDALPILLLSGFWFLVAGFWVLVSGCWFLVSGLLRCDVPSAAVVQAGGGVCCLATSSTQVAAGLTSGHAAVLDARSGTVTACWKGHDATVTRLAIVDTHQIITSSQVLSGWHLITTCHVQHAGHPSFFMHHDTQRSLKCSLGLHVCCMMLLCWGEVLACMIVWETTIFRVGA